MQIKIRNTYSYELTSMKLQYILRVEVRRYKQIDF